MRKLSLGCLACLFLLLTALPALAVYTIPFETTILLPNGKPAVNARVTVRVMNDDRTLHHEQHLTPDARGHVASNIAFQLKPLAASAYVLIDAPDCTLAFFILTFPYLKRTLSWTLMPPYIYEIPKTITLHKATYLTGVAVDPLGKPVPNAKVVVVSTPETVDTDYPNISFNSSLTRITTPQLIAKTDKDGRFHLRGSEVPGALGKGGAFVGKIRGQHGKNILVGDLRLNYNLPPEQLKERTVRLAMTAPLHGNVVNAVTGKPVRGALVRMICRWGTGLDTTINTMTATSGVDGKYLFTAVPPVDEMIAYATCPGYGDGYAAIQTGGHSRTGRCLPFNSTTQYKIALRPTVRITGKVLDAVTGRPVIGLPLSLFAKYDKGYFGANLEKWIDAIEAPVRKNGSFTINVPAGKCQFYVYYGPQYRYSQRTFGFGSDSHVELSLTPSEIEVNKSGKISFTIKRKYPFVFIRLKGKLKDDHTVYMYIKRDQHEQMNFQRSGYYIISGQPGEKLQYRLMQNWKTIKPLTPFTIDPVRWVQELDGP